ncbi:hypothetical protein NG2371_01655 [Nocardia gamkensis]|nr:hypothetical protein [Nocardia gamkensis]
MNSKVSALASLAASIAVIGGVCAFNAGPVYADPLVKYHSSEACEKEAARRNADYRRQNADSTAPGVTYYCEPWEWVENKSWGLFVKANSYP